MGKNSYTQSKCLPYVFREELKPILERLSWSKCQKRIFCGCDRFTGGKGRKRMFKSMHLETGLNRIKGLQKIDKIRLHQACIKIAEKYKQRRRILRQLRKKKKKIKEKLYIPGTFSKYSFPDKVDLYVERPVEVKFICDHDV